MTYLRQGTTLRFFSLLLVFSLLLGAQGANPPQSPSPPPPVFVPQATPGMSSGPSVKPAPGIKILVLEGRMQVNRLADGIFATPVVEVRNSNDMPIEGAKVTISLPGGNGAGAAYADGSLEKTFTTNSQGQVMAEGYTPNNVEGKFSVRIRAEYGADRVEIVIPQANSMVPQAEATRKTPLWRKKWLWISAAAVAGGVTAIVLTRGDSSSKPGVITVTPGPPVIGVR